MPKESPRGSFLWLLRDPDATPEPATWPAIFRALEQPLEGSGRGSGTGHVVDHIAIEEVRQLAGFLIQP